MESGKPNSENMLPEIFSHSVKAADGTILDVVVWEKVKEGEQQPTPPVAPGPEK